MMLDERVFIVTVDGILYRVVLFKQFMFVKIREILCSNISVVSHAFTYHLHIIKLEE